MLTNKQLFLQNLGMTSASPLMVEVEKAEGIYLYGPGGKKYIDLISGVSVSNIGHCHPQVVQAVVNQTENYLHLMVYGEMIQAPQVKYAALLTESLPRELNIVYFVNSGSEAVEGALKLARRHTHRSKIIYFRNAYHGSTMGALSVQGSEVYKNSFRPLIPDTWQINFNDFDALDIIDRHTACIIIEPVQAEAGVIYPDPGFLDAIRNKCFETGSLLIFDESQTGFGRIGKLFALNKFNIVPDILILSKALGGGMPLGAFISSQKIMSDLTTDPPLGHITTFGGHPVCCAAGLASMNVIIDEKLHLLVPEKSECFRKFLTHKAINEIRGDGLLLAIKLNDKKYLNYIIQHAPDHGLILDYFLFCNDAFRIAPPLTINYNEIETACSKLNNLIDEAVKNC